MQIFTGQDIHRHGRRVGPGPRGGRSHPRAPAATRCCSTSTPRPAARRSRRSARRRGSRRPTSRARSRSRRPSTSRSSAFGGLHGVVNAAGIGPAAKVLGKNGPHPLDLFEKTIRVNLVGTFNVIRLAAAVIAQNAPRDERRARRDHQHRVDCRVRRPDRPAGLRGVEGRHRRPDAAGRARVRAARHPRRHDRAGHLRHAAPGGAARSRRACRSASRCRSRRGSAGRPSTRALARHIIENEMLNGEVIRLDGALRMAPR